jgi:capsular polysaccharide transport system permease protein
LKNIAKLRLKTKHWFLTFVGIPTLLAVIYYGLIASDQYYSQSVFIVKSVDQKGGQVSSLASLVQTTGLSAGQEQTNEILDYIRSRNALQDVEKKVGFRVRYDVADADFLSRYPAPFRDDKFENLYRYYGNVVDAHIDKETNNAVLMVRAFTPQDAQKINAALLGLSEDLVNRLNARAEKRAIAEATRQVDDATKRVIAAQKALGTYRNAQEIVDPAKQAVGVFDITTSLITQQAALKSQLEQMERTAPAHPAIPALKSRIAALSNQIAAQTGRAVGTRNGIASKMGAYDQLALEQDLAAKNLGLANAAFEQARTDAAKQKFYLERIVEPDTPDMPLYPARIRSILVVLAASICLFLVAWMLAIGILEHAPEDL